MKEAWLCAPALDWRSCIAPGDMTMEGRCFMGLLVMEPCCCEREARMRMTATMTPTATMRLATEPMIGASTDASPEDSEVEDSEVEDSEVEEGVDAPPVTPPPSTVAAAEGATMALITISASD